MTSLMWFRRDVRLVDNPALLAASAAGPVVPVFVLDPRLTRPSGTPRLAFLLRSLKVLEESLGGALVLRVGDPSDVVPRLSEEAGASAVFAAADFGPYGRDRDAAVATRLARAGVAFEAVESPYAVPPDGITKSDGTPYRVFTPFYRAWREHPPAAPAPIPPGLAPAHHIASDPFPPEPQVDAELPVPGEAGARQRLDEFVGGEIDAYEQDRDRPDRDHTSRLSPYLKFGCIHPRQVLDRLGKGRAHEALRRQLAWRDFYAQVLLHHPGNVRRAFRPELDAIEWTGGEEEFTAWTEGRTGFPLVDAGMRQLAATGWMHNRARLVAATFLTKDLHVDWRRGEAYFMRLLLDGDVAQNNGNWQWVSSVGVDPAPMQRRLYNPELQRRRHDPGGEYVRRWIPELDDDYPEPIVDHAVERRAAIAAYRAAKL